MKKSNKKNGILVKATEKSLMTMAEIFSTIACNGRAYEPKVPQQLKK